MSNLPGNQIAEAEGISSLGTEHTTIRPRDVAPLSDDQWMDPTHDAARIKVWLDGHRTDLQVLAVLFDSGDTRVVLEDGRYYLTSPEIENSSDGENPHAVAQRVLSILNGLAALHHRGFRPVELGGRVTDGGSEVIYPRPALLELRGGVPVVTQRRPDGTEVPGPPSPWPGRAALAGSHPDVAEALGILGRTNPITFRELYDVYEIVRDSIQKDETMPNAVHELLGVSKNGVSRFTVPAQKARHARSTAEINNPMSLEEGRQFITELLNTWMARLRSADQ